MSDWEFLEYHAECNRVLYGRDVEGGMELMVQYLVDPTLEANKQEANIADPGWKGDYHKIASLSPGIAYGDGYIAQALKEGDDKSISKFLNDSDNRHWRTKGGRV